MIYKHGEQSCQSKFVSQCLAVNISHPGNEKSWITHNLRSNPDLPL